MNSTGDVVEMAADHPLMTARPGLLVALVVLFGKPGGNDVGGPGWA